MSLSKPELACEHILQTLKLSKLTFSIQETPFSAYITIRKKFSQSVPVNLHGQQISLNSCESFEMLTQENSKLKLKVSEYEREIEDLVVENKGLLEFIDTVKKDAKTKPLKVKSESLNDNLQKNLDNVIKENKSLVNDIEILEGSLKSVNKTLKQKDKKIHDLEKDIENIAEKLKIEKAELTSFKSQVNKERKQAERKNKKSEQKEFIENLKYKTKLNTLECRNCDETFTSEETLKNHIKNLHTKSASTQTPIKELYDKKTQVNHEDCNEIQIAEVFHPYKCFYCDLVLTSDIQLKGYSEKCHEHSIPTLPSTSKSNVKTSLPRIVKPKHLEQNSPMFSFPFGFPPTFTIGFSP